MNMLYGFALYFYIYVVFTSWPSIAVEDYGECPKFSSLGYVMIATMLKLNQSDLSKINEAWCHLMDLQYSFIIGLDFQVQFSVLFILALLFFLYYFGILTLKQM
jgi:hypothetical protein